ncbi:MAG: exodeoxyribonuclease VII large subunit [Acholeplasmataceae bacterium]|nr:exodeoxyribonuclease VII large subunit [Acholeplasmataceae bacterium]
MERKYLTVTALNRYLKFKFDNDRNLQDVLLKAEISNFKRHSRGHLYFTLKDDSSQIAAIMFAGNAEGLQFFPKDGQEVIVEGYVSVYEPQGTYQVYVKKMTQAGVGDLYLAYQRLKDKLEAEGLFQSNLKQSIPKYPKKIGVITSETGAAIRDIIHIINRRYPLTGIIVYPTLVQGDQAKTSIVDAIEKANRQKLVDVLIIGRGGGSIEDLWAFNEECVARAIRASKIPTISAVGHETDYTIADFAADLRAPTPSGAAELSVPDQRELLDYLHQLTNRLSAAIQSACKVKADRLANLEQSPVLKHPERLLENRELRLSSLQERLQQLQPLRITAGLMERVANLEKTLAYNIGSIRQKYSHNFQILAEKLELVNPFQVIDKGYAIIKRDGVFIKTVASVTAGDDIEVIMKDGQLACEVRSVRKETV